MTIYVKIPSILILYKSEPFCLPECRPLLQVFMGWMPVLDMGPFFGGLFSHLNGLPSPSIAPMDLYHNSFAPYIERLACFISHCMAHRRLSINMWVSEWVHMLLQKARHLRSSLGNHKFRHTIGRCMSCRHRVNKVHECEILSFVSSFVGP